MQYFKSLLCVVPLATAFMIMCSSLTANHPEHRFDTDSRLSGNSLEFEFWNAVQNHNDESLNELVSPLFLGGNTLGSRDFNTEIAMLKNLSITSFTISNVVESQDEDIRMISYDFSAVGPMTSISDHRISVWHRKKHKHHQFFWQLISQSSFSTNT